MMKRIIRILLSAVICMTVLLSSAMPAGSVMARYWPIGDADRDYELTIMDVTRIQRYLAGFYHSDPGFNQELYDTLCDADGSGTVTILDATCLQRYLADLPNSYRPRELTDYYVGDTSFHCTAEIDAPGGDGSREIAYVGVPVTFTARLKWGNPPQRYRFSIDGETVWEKEADGERTCAVTYTFTREGTYEVQLDAACKYGVSKTFRHRVDVRSLPEDGSPVVMGAAFFDQSWMSSGNGDLTVTAAGGETPYEYNYTVYYAASPYEIPTEPEAEPDSGVPATEKPVETESSVTTGYVSYHTVNPLQMLKRPAGVTDDLYIRVTVRDAKGRESEPVTVVCYQYEICL